MWTWPSVVSGGFACYFGAVGATGKDAQRRRIGPCTAWAVSERKVPPVATSAVEIGARSAGQDSRRIDGRGVRSHPN
jgi:hypothetical protein